MTRANRLFLRGLTLLLLGQPIEASGQAARADPSPGSSLEALPDMTARFGIALRASTLGLGVEVATPVRPQFNVRFGVNLFRFTQSFFYHGLDYEGPLIAQSVETHADWFPFGGAFHVSPGLMLYNGNRADLRAGVAAGRTFSLGDATYLSDLQRPVEGTLRVEFDRVNPTVLVGWGNLLSRTEKRFSLAVEAGVVFQGSARATLTLSGNACRADGVADCRDAGVDPEIVRSVSAEEERIRSHETSHPYLRFYPVVTGGIGYRF